MDIRFSPECIILVLSTDHDVLQEKLCINKVNYSYLFIKKEELILFDGIKHIFVNIYRIFSASENNTHDGVLQLLEKHIDVVPDILN